LFIVTRITGGDKAGKIASRNGGAARLPPVRCRFSATLSGKITGEE
jgi:hypothetical protein